MPEEVAAELVAAVAAESAGETSDPAPVGPADPDREA
jgi:hypothetical protein